MLSLYVFLATIVFSIGFLILQHVYAYLRDAKGLRRFPGMHPLSPLTSLPYMWHASQGRRYKAVDEAHQRLGPIVRTGPNAVSFNDVQGVKDIYGHGSPVVKDTFYANTAGTHRHLADVSDKADHSRKRRVLAAAFAQAGLESWEHIVAGRTGALVDQYDRLTDNPEYVCSPNHGPDMKDPKAFDGYINHRHWMVLFGQDAIAQIGLSADLNLIENGHDNVEVEDLQGNKALFPYRESLWRSQRIQSCFAWSNDYWYTLKRLSSWHSGWTADHNYNAIVLHLVRRRLKRYEAGEKLDDFFTHLFEDKYGKPNMYPMGELAAEASIMLNAGSDTTSIALTNVFYILLKNPDKLAKLRAELDGVLSPEDKVAPYDRVKHLPYLRAVLDESMRIHPPNTMNVPRKTPPEGMSIMGHWIPGDTTVHCPPYSMHRNPKVFYRPDEFIPERWLEEGGKELQAHFIPFSAGARSCIGRNITYLEQIMVLASLIHRFDMELMSPDWELRREETFTCAVGDMPIKVRKRKFSIKE